jgi:hypothetical protein
MITKRKSLTCLAALLLLSGCVTTRVASPLPTPPADVFQAPDDEDMLAVMVAATDGAQGLKEDWLIDYAARAERYRIQLIQAQAFVENVWKSRQ